MFEERVRQAEEQDRQTNAEKAEWISLAQTIRSDRLEDGSLRFGPQGYGIYDVDANGNITQPTPQGRIALEKAHAIMSERGWPRTMAALEDALSIVASELAVQRRRNRSTGRWSDGR